MRNRNNIPGKKEREREEEGRKRRSLSCHRQFNSFSFSSFLPENLILTNGMNINFSSSLFDTWREREKNDDWKNEKERREKERREKERTREGKDERKLLKALILLLVLFGLRTCFLSLSL